MIKIICSDLDGTLLDDKKRLSSENLSMIKKWQQTGHIFGIVSGRQISGIQRVYEDKFQPDFLVGLNGSWVRYLSSMERFYPISYQHLKLLNEKLIALKVKKIVVTQQGISREVILTSENQFFTTNLDIEKVSVVLPNKEAADLLYSQIQDLPLQITQSDYRYVEISEQGRSKLTGLIDAVGEENIAHTAAIGNFYNDIELIKAVNLGAVVGNGVPELKKYANLIVADNNHSAVADLIERLLK